MKTREQIITDMCYTWRHDYGLDKSMGTGFADIVSSGMTKSEREALWSQMAQIYDNCIAPHMVLKHNQSNQWEQYNWKDWSEP